MHEIGHFLDDALGGFAVYSCWEPESPVQRVLRVAEESRALLELRTYVEATPNLIAATRFQALNRLEAVEVWARCFAQYIALHSGDNQMQQEVEQRRYVESGVLRNEQWEWNDFDKIAEATDAMFLSLGWRRE